MAKEKAKKKPTISGRPQPLPRRSGLRKDPKTKYDDGGKISRKKNS